MRRVERNDVNNKKDIVYYYAKIFEVLKWVSVFALLRKLLGGRPIYSKNPERFVELWVVGHLFVSFISVVIVCFVGEFEWVVYPLIIYGLLRTFEIVIYQINMLMFDQYRAERSGRNYSVKGYRRTVILLAHNFFEIIFWFAVSYLNSLELFKIENDLGNNIAQALYISFVTMTTFGPPNFNISDSLSLYFISIQSFIGLVMTLLTLARFISLLPNVKSKSE